MSILDDEEEKLSHLDNNIDELLTKKLMRQVFEISHEELDDNNTADQISRDIFNREVRIGDWVLYFKSGFGYGCEFCQVKSITSKMIRVKYIKITDLYTGEPFYGIKNVYPENIIKVSDKDKFYKEIMKN